MVFATVSFVSISFSESSDATCPPAIASRSPFQDCASLILAIGWHTRSFLSDPGTRASHRIDAANKRLIGPPAQTVGDWMTLRRYDEAPFTSSSAAWSLDSSSCDNEVCKTVPPYCLISSITLSGVAFRTNTKSTDVLG